MKKQKVVLGTQESMRDLLGKSVDGDQLAVLVMHGVLRTLQEFMQVVDSESVTMPTRIQVSACVTVVENCLDVLRHEATRASMMSEIPDLDEKLGALAEGLRAALAAEENARREAPMRESADPRYDAEKRRRAAQLYGELGSVRKVAEALGVSTRRAWELLDDAGVQMNPRGRPRDKESHGTEA